MWLVKQMVEFYKRPVCEILELPAEELEWWACFNRINTDKSKPNFPKYKTTEAEDIAAMKRVLHG